MRAALQDLRCSQRRLQISPNFNPVGPPTITVGAGEAAAILILGLRTIQLRNSWMASQPHEATQ